MRSIILILCLSFCYSKLPAQALKKPADFGFRYLTMLYKNDTVDVLVESKKGEENKVKPCLPV